MLTIVGAVIVLGCVIGGFLMEGGHIAVLIQPAELVIIFGAAMGSIVISCPVPLIKEIIKQLKAAILGKEPSAAEYTELLLLLYEIIKTAKANPLSLEPHVENPESSEIFRKYPAVMNNHHAVAFLCDTLKVQISSPVSPYDLEDLMEKDMASAHDEESKAPGTIARVGDAMPGLGIVAAVMGVVITMGKLAQGKEVIGHSVAAALVGTFLGVLLSYGFFQPTAAKMEIVLISQGKFLDVIKSGILAFAKDCSPKICVEFARRTIPPKVRPTFDEVDKATSQLKAAA